MPLISEGRRLSVPPLDHLEGQGSGTMGSRGVEEGVSSCLTPSQTSTYLGMVIVSPSVRAFPSQERVSNFLTQAAKFLSFRRQNVVSRRALLGRLSSLCHLVPAGHLRMCSLQLLLREQWDFVDPEIGPDLLWWSDARHLLAGVSLVSPQPELLF